MNGLLIIDKPAGWTSHDVVARLRGILKEKRIGHGGTLDPMATGVLPVFIGRATRAVPFCESFDKEYVAGLRLGLVTDTQDTTGRVLSESDVSVSRDEVENVVRGFLGEQAQIPPMYSAVKVGGRRLYELARRGVEADRKPRTITVYELEVLSQSGSDWLLRLCCSKGTYVRTICHDIGRKLGCGGAMCSLRRTRVGSFTLDGAVSLDDVEAAVRAGRTEDVIKRSTPFLPGIRRSGSTSGKNQSA
jgi:tRNA pseudouridine55 synthase